jgi:putative flippase GtrA
LNALSLLLKKLLAQNFVRFVIVGSGAFAIDLLTYESSLHYLKMNHQLAYATGVVLATAFAFFLSKKWAFANQSQAWGKQSFLFALGRLAVIALTWYLYSVFHKRLEATELPYQNEISKIGSVACGFLINFFFAKLVVFKEVLSKE